MPDTTMHDARISAAMMPHPPTGTGDDPHPRPADPRDRRATRWLRLGLIMLTLVLYGRDWTLSRGAYGDSFHHLINGVFIHDVLIHPRDFLADPVAFGAQYYLHYPAVSLGYYMPGFAAIEAVLMLMFGVSAATGQLAVLLCAVLMAVFAFEWFRLRFGHWWSAGGTVILMSMPQLVYWGRDIMLEIPMMAFVMGAIWMFEKLARDPRPAWRAAIVWGLLTAAACLIKQNALMLLGVYFISTIAMRRWGHLRFGSIWAGVLICVVAAALVVAITFALGGDAVGHSVGFTKQHVLDRFNIDQWTYYLRILPKRVGYLTLILAGIGLIGAFQTRDRYVWPSVMWIVCFYVMHSYFKAQSARYACLWLPPFCMLGLMGLRSVCHGFQHPPGSGRRSARWIGVAMLMIYASTMLAHTVNLVPYIVSSAYQRAADDLSERLGPFTCMTFFPDRPGRIAVCYRLAVEERHRQTGEDIYAFGRILRAKQVLTGWRDRWQTVETVTDKLKLWNVKFILTETPRSMDAHAGDTEIHAIMRGIIATGDFQPIRTYQVLLDPVYRYPKRTLTLYERVGPLDYHPGAIPPVHTGRIPLDMARAAMHQ